MPFEFSNVSDRFCGQILSCNHGDTAHAGVILSFYQLHGSILSYFQVMTTVKPFGFRVYFNNAGDDNSGDRGFALNYRQEMC